MKDIITYLHKYDVYILRNKMNESRNQISNNLYRSPEREGEREREREREREGGRGEKRERERESSGSHSHRNFLLNHLFVISRDIIDPGFSVANKH